MLISMRVYLMSEIVLKSKLLSCKSWIYFILKYALEKDTQAM